LALSKHGIKSSVPKKLRRLVTLTVSLALSLSPALALQPGLSVEQSQEFTTQSTGYQWTSHGPSDGVADQGWGSVTFADGIFVAVSVTGSNRVMTSADGAQWTPQTVPAQKWTAVTSGLVGGVNRFVAVSEDGDKPVMTSDDGVTWTLQTAPSGKWWSITYGDGLFVAVSDSVQAGSLAIMTSPDGISWTTRTAPAVGWSSVTYGSGQFVAVRSSAADGGARAMYSADGVTWSSAQGVPANGWYSVAYGAGRFVAVAFSGADRIMTSTDGINWAAVTDSASKTLGASDFWYAVGFGGGKFVAATFGSNNVMTSSDGLIWTADTAFAAVWRSVAYGNNTYVVVADGNGASARVERFGPVAPTAPTQLSADPTLYSVTISFTPGLANGGAITNYEYSLDGGQTYISLHPADASSPITISGLTEGTTYEIFLRAVNSFGPGDASAKLTVTTLTPVPPAAPSAPDLAASSDTGASDTDNLTADNTPTISVAGTLSDHTVTVTATKSGESDVSCSFEATAETSCDLGELADGVWSITSVQQADGGLVSEESLPLLITVDTAAPTTPSLQIDSAGNILTLTFGEPLGEAGLGTEGFLVTVNGNPVAVAASQLTISGLTFVIELAAPALAGQAVVVNYNASSLSDPNFALADIAGNMVSSFSLSVSRPSSEAGGVQDQSPITPPPAVTPTDPTPTPPEAGTEVGSAPTTGPGSEVNREPLAKTGFSGQQLFVWAVLTLLVGVGFTRLGGRRAH
jgi:hypothetical protein